MDKSGPGERRSRGKQATAVDHHIGGRLRLWRHLLGVGLIELAGHLGVSYQQLHRYETGQHRISASTLYEVARVLGADITHFFEGLPATASEAKAMSLAKPAHAFYLTPEGKALADLVQQVPEGEPRRLLIQSMTALASALTERHAGLKTG